jgi:hypothetical protein
LRKDLMNLMKLCLRGAAQVAVILSVVLTPILGAQATQPDWPRAMEVPEGKIVIYQPQPESFEGNKLAARFAISVTPSGSVEPVFGVAWVEARVDTDGDARVVEVVGLSVDRVRFPDSTEDQENTLAAILEAQRFPAGNWNSPLIDCW